MAKKIRQITEETAQELCKVIEGLNVEKVIRDKNIMHRLIDKGRINTTHEEIDKHK